MADPAGLRLALLALRRGFIDQPALTRAIREQEQGKDREGLLDILVRHGALPAERAQELQAAEPAAATVAGGGQTVSDGTITDGRRDEAALTAVRPEAARTRLGEYLLLKVLGSGGMGVVYEALHEPLQRKVALKVLSPALHSQDSALERFHREVRAAARLHHPNIVPVFDVGEEQGTHYFAMELVDGKTLEQLAQTSELSYDEIAANVQSIAEALHYAHSQGIVHRDVKPSNVIRTQEGRVLITDFGVAKELTEAGITASGALLGTPAYMSPEQAAGSKEPIDARTDVYALGATLYDLCTKRRPFVGESFESTLAKVLFQDPERPSLVRPGIPQDLETIILKAMSKEPDRRYATAQELADDLGRYRKGEPILARPMTTVNRMMRKIRRHRTAVGVGSAALLVFVVGGGVLISMIREQRAKEAEMAHQAAEREAQQKKKDAARDLVRSGLMLKGHTPADALVNFDKAVETDPDSYEARLERGRFHREQGDFRAALDDLRKAIELAPDQIDGYAERMVLYLCMNDFLHVAGDLDTILKRWPTHRWAKMGKACLLYLSEKREEAAAEFGKVIAESPNEALAYAGRGGCLLELHKYNEALEDLNHALTLEPKNVMALNNRAQLMLEAGQIDRAIADAGLSIDYYPSFFWPWEIRGKGRLQKGLLADAEADLEQSFKLGPTRGDTVMYLGICYGLERKHTAAVKALTRALKLGADRGWSLYYRGLSYAETGQFPEAQGDATDLRKNANLTPYALGVEANTALRQGDAAACVKLADEALAAAPRLVEVLVVRARGYAAQEKFDEALESYRTACVMDGRQTALVLDELNEVKKKKEEKRRE